MPRGKRTAKKYGKNLPSSSRLSDTPQRRLTSETQKKSMKYSQLLQGETWNCTESPILPTSSIAERKTDEFINISELLKVTWKVFRVSPLYNFKKNILKSYARRIMEEITVYNTRQEESVCDCDFSLAKLVLHEEHEIIKVSLKANNSKYTGYLISMENPEKNEEAFRHFPLLLVQSGEKLLKQVHNVLCKFFDCDIHAASFSFYALITFFSLMSHMYIQDVPDLCSEVVTLHYRIPGCPPSDSVSAGLSLDATSTVFAVFDKQFGEALVSQQKMLVFYEWILNHILNVYRFDFSSAHLFKIIFPHFAIASEGWVKFSSEEVFKKTLPIIQNFVKLDNYI